MKIKTWKRKLEKGETAKVITQMIDVLEQIDADDYNNMLILLLSRHERLKKDIINGLLTEDEASVEQSRIVRSVLYTMEEMEEDGILAQYEIKEISFNNEVITQEIIKVRKDLLSKPGGSMDGPISKPGGSIDPVISKPGGSIDPSVENIDVDDILPKAFTAPVDQLQNLEDLKKRAIWNMKIITSLRKEESFTLGGIHLFKLQESIKIVTSEYEVVKQSITNFAN